MAPVPAMPLVDEQRSPGGDQYGSVRSDDLQLPGVGDPAGHTGPARRVVPGAGHDEPYPARALRAQRVQQGAQPGPEVGVRCPARPGGADHHRDDAIVRAEGMGHFLKGRQREGVVVDRAHQQNAVDLLDGQGAAGSAGLGGPGPVAAARADGRSAGAAPGTGPAPSTGEGR
ncbi:hypothetical protein ACTMUQ_02450 [Streptomyces sp. SD11]|uniref:hypothetical protein n=1 Tax=Streptomyces sp. SD11 TaxID=3452209 RepID=UPI003F8A4E61